MNTKLKIIFTGIITFLIWAHLLWDYTHGGVPTHYLLHDDNLPGFSNWWGGLILPALTWVLLSRIQQRINTNQTDLKNSGIRFISALLFGLTISILFMNGEDQFQLYMMLGAIILSFIFPLYLSEYLLGFVLGMAFTFGAILPLIIGVVLLIIFWIAFKIRVGISHIFLRFK